MMAGTSIFIKLAEQYDARIEFSRSQSIVRFTGNYAICSDLSKLVYYMIEKIQSADMELPTVVNPMRYKDSASATARSALNDKSYVEHIERLTNTIIKTTQSTQNNYVTKVDATDTFHLLVSDVPLVTHLLHRSRH